MGRPLRIEYEGAAYHIMARGNEKKNIFLEEADFKKFFYYLGVVWERYKLIIYSYVLMNNHYHLLMETPQANLSRAIRDLNGHYTIYFNRKYKRIGHLFQGRYKAILVDKENYLLELSRYIHLNPVRAGSASKPEIYPYSSMAGYLSKDAVVSWMNVDFILSQFGGNDLMKQKRMYKGFVDEGIVKQRDFFKAIYANTILGTEGFVEAVIKKHTRTKNISKQVPRTKQLQYGKDLKNIAEAVLNYYNEKEEILKKRKMKDNRARKIFVYLVRKYTDFELSRVIAFLGDAISESGISKLHNRTLSEIETDVQLRKEMQEIKEQVLG